MDIHTSLVAIGGIFGAVGTFISQTIGLDPLALLFALLTPILLLYSRHETRLRRLRAIKDFLRVFGSSEESGTNKDAEQVTPSAARGRLVTNPSFEFVKSKYTADLTLNNVDGKTPYDDLGELDQINRAIDCVGRFGSMPDFRLLISSLGLILLTYFGFAILHESLYCGLGTDAWSIDGKSCAATASGFGNWWQIAVIGSLAFAGAYVGAVRNIARAVAVFDLSSYTFLRQTIEMAASVIFTVILFALLRNVLLAMTDIPANVDWTKADTHIQPVWYGLAPLLGLVPQSATKFLMVKFQSNGYLNWVKVSEDAYNPITRLISLDIIDGIDYETRFRLEECGIYDVQNLAAYNPVMLHIESPYGIYQVIDWVAQAQLCHILGPEKFLIFREFNIRTIFDLERAIMSRQSFRAFDELCAGILFMPTSNLRKTLDVNQSQLVLYDGSESKKVDADAYCLWVSRKIQEGGGDGVPPVPPVATPQDATEKKGSPTDHVLRWIADDLHVRRLRRLWIDISESLGEKSWFLPDSIDAQRAMSKRVDV
jgi:hypothetical protein